MNPRPLPKLLVSVRSAAEARAALAGGADLIDVKEPARGAMGSADVSVIRGVLSDIGGRVPVSAALGEWLDGHDWHVPDGLTYAKWGLAGRSTLSSDTLLQIRTTCHALFPVLVAYADNERANSPDPDLLADAAIRYHFPAFLIDTAVKDGSTLLDWVEPAALARIRFRLADAGVPLALAGSLAEPAIRKLAALEPDWFAVRGAACDGGRMGEVSADRVRRLREVIADAAGTFAG
jgi:(5-formylfuran-3-yl)methyl phosphate synthase